METSQVRRTATSVFLFALAIALAAAYVFLVFYENTISFGAGWITQLDLYYWVIAFSVMLVLALVLLLILYFVPPQDESAESEGLYEQAPATEEYMAPSAEAPVEPMAPQATETTELPAPVVAEADALLVKCSNCQHEFEIPYQTARPVYATCPKCGEEAVLEEGEEVLTPGGVPVIDIEGIGPISERKLREAGVTTSEQLRHADAQRLADRTGLALRSIENWQAQADFLRMEGVGKQLAELLALAGYRDLEDLARAKPEEVSRRVKAYLKSVDAPPTKTGIDLRRARDFVAQAKKLKNA